MLSAQVWEEEGEKRIYFSPSKVSHVGVSFTRERLREEKEERQGGGREGVEGKGDHNSAKCLGFYPFQSCWLAMYLVNIL